MGLHLLHFFLMSIGAPKKKLDDLLVQLKKNASEQYEPALASYIKMTKANNISYLAFVLRKKGHFVCILCKRDCNRRCQTSPDQISAAND